MKLKHFDKINFENFINESLNISHDTIEKLAPKKELNQLIWEGDTLKDDVRTYMLLNAYEYIRSLKIKDLKITDITLTGSLANYNWYDESDIDLHIIFDFTQISHDFDFVDEFMRLKRKLWNDEHEITIKDFKVELYSQDVNEKHTSSGVYSIYFNKWINQPKLFDVDFDNTLIEDEYNIKIGEIININKISNDDIKIKSINDFIEELREYRKKGLEREGEYSVENLVFKLLRYNNVLTDLRTDKIDIINNKLSL